MSTKFKNIVITDANYKVLKQLGNAGDSFNDVVTNILKKVKIQLQGEGRYAE